MPSNLNRVPGLSSVTNDNLFSVSNNPDAFRDNNLVVRKEKSKKQTNRQTSQQLDDITPTGAPSSSDSNIYICIYDDIYILQRGTLVNTKHEH
jgi:hypothetical protein